MPEHITTDETNKNFFDSIKTEKSVIIQRIFIGNKYSAFTTDNGEFWACGNCPGSGKVAQGKQQAAQDQEPEEEKKQGKGGRGDKKNKKKGPAQQAAQEESEESSDDGGRGKKKKNKDKGGKSQGKFNEYKGHSQ